MRRVFDDIGEKRDLGKQRRCVTKFTSGCANSWPRLRTSWKIPASLAMVSMKSESFRYLFDVTQKPSLNNSASLRNG